MSRGAPRARRQALNQPAPTTRRKQETYSYYNAQNLPDLPVVYVNGTATPTDTVIDEALLAKSGFTVTESGGGNQVTLTSEGQLLLYSVLVNSGASKWSSTLTAETAVSEYKAAGYGGFHAYRWSYANGNTASQAYPYLIANYVTAADSNKMNLNNSSTVVSLNAASILTDTEQSTTLDMTGWLALPQGGEDGSGLYCAGSRPETGRAVSLKLAFKGIGSALTLEAFRTANTADDGTVNAVLRDSLRGSTTNDRQFAANFNGNGGTIKLALDNRLYRDAGLFGTAAHTAGTYGEIKDLTVTGSVQSRRSAGGLVGYLSGLCYRMNNITVKDMTVSGGDGAGGIVGSIGHSANQSLGAAAESRNAAQLDPAWNGGRLATIDHAVVTGSTAISGASAGGLIGSSETSALYITNSVVGYAATETAVTNTADKAHSATWSELEAARRTVENGIYKMDFATSGVSTAGSSVSITGTGSAGGAIGAVELGYWRDRYDHQSDYFTISDSSFSRLSIIGSNAGGVYGSLTDSGVSRDAESELNCLPVLTVTDSYAIRNSVTSTAVTGSKVGAVLGYGTGSTADGEWGIQAVNLFVKGTTQRYNNGTAQLFSDISADNCTVSAQEQSEQHLSGLQNVTLNTQKLRYTVTEPAGPTCRLVQYTGLEELLRNNGTLSDRTGEDTLSKSYQNAYLPNMVSNSYLNLNSAAAASASNNGYYGYQGNGYGTVNTFRSGRETASTNNAAFWVFAYDNEQSGQTDIRGMVLALRNATTQNGLLGNTSTVVNTANRAGSIFYEARKAVMELQDDSFKVTLMKKAGTLRANGGDASIVTYGSDTGDSSGNSYNLLTVTYNVGKAYQSYGLSFTETYPILVDNSLNVGVHNDLMLGSPGMTVSTLSQYPATVRTEGNKQKSTDWAFLTGKSTVMTAEVNSFVDGAGNRYFVGSYLAPAETEGVTTESTTDGNGITTVTTVTTAETAAGEVKSQTSRAVYYDPAHYGSFVSKSTTTYSGSGSSYTAATTSVYYAMSKTRKESGNAVTADNLDAAVTAGELVQVSGSDGQPVEVTASKSLAERTLWELNSDGTYSIAAKIDYSDLRSHLNNEVYDVRTVYTAGGDAATYRYPIYVSGAVTETGYPRYEYRVYSSADADNISDEDAPEWNTYYPWEYNGVSGCYQPTETLPVIRVDAEGGTLSAVTTDGSAVSGFGSAYSALRMPVYADKVISWSISGGSMELPVGTSFTLYDLSDADGCETFYYTVSEETQNRSRISLSEFRSAEGDTAPRNRDISGNDIQQGSAAIYNRKGITANYENAASEEYVLVVNLPRDASYLGGNDSVVLTNLQLTTAERTETTAGRTVEATRKSLAEAKRSSVSLYGGTDLFVSERYENEAPVLVISNRRNLSVEKVEPATTELGTFGQTPDSKLNFRFIFNDRLPQGYGFAKDTANHSQSYSDLSEAKTAFTAADAQYLEMEITLTQDGAGSPMIIPNGTVATVTYQVSTDAGIVTKTTKLRRTAYTGNNGIPILLSMNGAEGVTGDTTYNAWSVLENGSVFNDFRAYPSSGVSSQIEVSLDFSNVVGDNFRNGSVYEVAVNLYRNSNPSAYVGADLVSRIAWKATAVGSADYSLHLKPTGTNPEREVDANAAIATNADNAITFEAEVSRIESSDETAKLRYKLEYKDADGVWQSYSGERFNSDAEAGTTGYLTPTGSATLGYFKLSGIAVTRGAATMTAVQTETAGKNLTSSAEWNIWQLKDGIYRIQESADRTLEMTVKNGRVVKIGGTSSSIPGGGTAVTVGADTVYYWASGEGTVDDTTDELMRYIKNNSMTAGFTETTIYQTKNAGELLQAARTVEGSMAGGMNALQANHSDEFAYSYVAMPYSLDFTNLQLGNYRLTAELVVSGSVITSDYIIFNVNMAV